MRRQMLQPQPARQAVVRILGVRWDATFVGPEEIDVLPFDLRDSERREERGRDRAARQGACESATRRDGAGTRCLEARDAGARQLFDRCDDDFWSYGESSLTYTAECPPNNAPFNGRAS